MQRAIAGWQVDPAGDWVAELDCKHRQHVRHQPPWQERPWVLDAAARAERVGQLIECAACDRAEMPEGLPYVRTTPEFTSQTVPAALRRAHRVADGVWGRVRVLAGALRFRSAGVDLVLTAGEWRNIPPGVEHEVEPDGDARFAVEFWR